MMTHGARPSTLVPIMVLATITGCACLKISDFGPASGLPGTVVEVRGGGFDPDPFKNGVTIGGSTARVISGDTNHLRVVALRDVATGPVVVTAGSSTATSARDFKREGSTAWATPLQDSDAELIVGQGFRTDRRYDMSAQGLNQKILVVLTKPSDINPEDLALAGKTARDSIIERLNQANVYFDQASYTKVSAAFTTTADWIPLSQKRDFYCWQQDDIDRSQAALDALLLDTTATQEQIDQAKSKLNAAKNAAGKLQEPNFLFAEALLGAKAAVADFDSYSDYLVIVAGPFLRGQNYGTQTGYSAETTNPALMIGPFDIDFAGPKGITYVAQEAAWDRIVHELSHFFAGGDLYSEGFADGSSVEGNAAPFAMMGDHPSKPLYIGYNLEKRLDYFDESSNGNVEFLEWGSTPDFDKSITLVAHAKSQDPIGDSTRHLIRLKVTDGMIYYAEVRQKPDAALGAASDYVFDPSIPLDPSNPAWKAGVIVYKAVENNNQSNNNERPVSLLPPGRMLQAGQSFVDPARTIRIAVEQKLADRPAKYKVRVEWGHLPAADPNGQFDLRISPWSPPPWESPDIWANSIKNDETSPSKIIYKNHDTGDETKPIGNGDPPWVKHDNTLFARIENQGQVATSESVLVTFYVNTPPGVGDNGNWAPFDTVDAGILAAGETKIVEASRKWRPAVDEHTCVKVEINKQTGEQTFDNNQAQENFNEFETGAASPYRPVEFDFIARNPYDAPGVMDIQARDVPLDWFVALNHGSVWLAPKEEKKVHAVIWTDRTAEWLGGEQRKSPRKAMINVEGWMDRWSDQSFAIGGVTAFTQAVRLVEIKIKERTKQGRLKEPFFVTGVVAPASGIVPVALHITEPDGTLNVERTVTNSAGTFNWQTKFTPHLSGPHALQAFVLEGSLASAAESVPVTIDVK